MLLIFSQNRPKNAKMSSEPQFSGTQTVRAHNHVQGPINNRATAKSGECAAKDHAHAVSAPTALPAAHVFPTFPPWPEWHAAPKGRGHAATAPAQPGPPNRVHFPQISGKSRVSIPHQFRPLFSLTITRSEPTAL